MQAKEVYCSLTTGIFPNDCKGAKVTPLLKQGSPKDMNNMAAILN